MTHDQAENLKRHMGVKARVHFEDDWRKARAVPKGGAAPKFMHFVERMGHKAMGGNDAHWQEAVKGHGAVHTSRDAEIAAHELGHLWMRKNRFARAALRHTRGPGAMLSTPVGAAMALGGKRGSKTVKAAPYVAALGHLPTLVDEAGASLKALHTLKHTGATMGQMAHARGNLARAFGTYALRAGASVAPIAVMSHMRRKAREESKK